MSVRNKRKSTKRLENNKQVRERFEKEAQDRVTKDLQSFVDRYTK